MAERIARILVPVDFSEHSERALQYATSLAEQFGARVHLLHVVQDPFVSGAWTSEAFVPNIPELLDTLVATSQRQLAAWKEIASGTGIGVETDVVTGDPAPGIVDYATKGGFDLIVMGTHGRTGLSHALLGSVAERVIRRAACPVLTVRAAESAVKAAA